MAEIKDKTYNIYQAKGQLKVTMPKVLPRAVGITKRDKVKWIIDRGDLVMKKASN